jgi:hypothetical protein
MMVGALGELFRTALGVPTGDEALLAIVGVALLLCASVELKLLDLRLPESVWQVPRSIWAPGRTGPAAFIWGVMLGVGVLTRISGRGFYGLACAVLLLGGIAEGALLFGLYGLSRTIPLHIFVRARDLAEMASQVDKVARRWRPALQLLNGVCLAAFGGWLTSAAGLGLIG